MSRELLYKFPDNFTFDFDYARRTIWSPLLPPPLHSDKETRVPKHEEEKEEIYGVFFNPSFSSAHSHFQNTKKAMGKGIESCFKAFHEEESEKRDPTTNSNVT
ncbi:Hypothetical predicted protein [Olea europaea subsp. europaea]|uniref:Uncharacterized protein n=1 Tax=Olea europaea subsp. europaea TaxID=158383 RepID=A0A8S0U038_OLEEU|nr:Hypothetical predicted protein [Olea europaea subsp. europaea]